MRFILLFAALAGFASTNFAEAAVSRLKHERGADRDAFSSYDHVVVGELADAVLRRRIDDDALQADIKAVGDRITERIATKLRESGKYESVERTIGDAPALLIDGKLTVFKRANVATRYLGLGAGSKLEGVIYARDAHTGENYGTIELEFSSSGIPGVTNLVQTIDAFIEGIAVRVTNEIMISQGKLHRHETGRSARLREKYSND